jgi:ketosteroid isomerase-like protein
MTNNEANNMKQDTQEINKIKDVLKQQKEYWNKGDIKGFMQGYWKSKDLVFTSLKYKPTYGWEATLKRYQESYPTQSSMGKLQFEIIEVILTSKNQAKLKGNWKLIREKDNPNGVFWLDLKKFDDNWLITKDSTMSYEL